MSLTLFNDGFPILTEVKPAVQYAAFPHVAAGRRESIGRLSGWVEMSRSRNDSEPTKDVQPLAEAPPVELQRAQAERLLRSLENADGVALLVVG